MPRLPSYRSSYYRRFHPYARYTPSNCQGILARDDEETSIPIINPTVSAVELGSVSMLDLYPDLDTNETIATVGKAVLPELEDSGEPRRRWSWGTLIIDLAIALRAIKL